jgi:hypothetical protein
VVKPEVVPWFPDRMAYQLNLTRKDIRREEIYFKLHNFLVQESGKIYFALHNFQVQQSGKIYFKLHNFLVQESGKIYFTLHDFLVQKSISSCTTS